MSYLPLASPIYAELEKMVLATYQNACIVWIEQVVQPDLEHKFDDYCATLPEPNVRRLFHGTGNEIAQRICEEGFRPELNRVSRYGKGVYFAVDAVYSKDYSRPGRDIYSQFRRDEIVYLIVSDVATGRTRMGSNEAVIPAGYDSFCDSPKDPKIFVVNKKEACCPRYLIAFYPGARP